VRIAVISDTHLSTPTPVFTEIFETHLLSADILVHCGDITGEEVLGLLMTHHRFFGVAGNMDGFGIRSVLPDSRIVDLLGVRIGIVHGWGRSGDLPQRTGALFAGRADLVCFGHSHRRLLMQPENGPLLVNPGSLLAPRDEAPGFCLIELDGESRPIVSFHDLAIHPNV
jgi:uncharacterized protein